MWIKHTGTNITFILLSSLSSSPVHFQFRFSSKKLRFTHQMEARGRKLPQILLHFKSDLTEARFRVQFCPCPSNSESFDPVLVLRILSWIGFDLFLLWIESVLTLIACDLESLLPLFADGSFVHGELRIHVWIRSSSSIHSFSSFPGSVLFFIALNLIPVCCCLSRYGLRPEQITVRRWWLWRCWKWIWDELCYGLWENCDGWWWFTVLRYC